MTLHGILDVSFWQAVLITLAMTHLTIAAVTIFLRRAQAHRALDLHPAVPHVFRFWLWLTTGMVTKEVLAPVSRAELCRDAAHCRRLIRQSRRLLAREGSRLDAAARVNLERLLAQSQTLTTVYQFRERLQAIWGRGAASQEVLLGNLQDWCRQAEATGIQALERFAQNLKGFSLAPMGTL